MSSPDKTEPANTLADWDFHSDHVEENVDNEHYIGAHSVLIAAGPPELDGTAETNLAANAEQDANQTDDDGRITPNVGSGADKDIVYPMGVVQNASLSQNRGLQRLFEVGSERSYFIPGRTSGSLRISRVMFHGKSLLRVLTAYYGNAEAGAGKSFDALTKEREELNLNSSPGSHSEYFINLASDLFDHPLGLMFYFKDNNGEPYGQFYLENVFIGNHSLQLGAGTTMISEGVSMQWDNMEPIEIVNVSQG